MRAVFSLLVVVLLSFFSVEAKESSPKVQVYSRNPGKYGEPNNLICHVSGFHPPDISIQLQRNGKDIPDAVQTDLAFEAGWQFHLTRSVKFTPQSDEVYTCLVTHMKKPKTYTWDPDM